MPATQVPGPAVESWDSHRITIALARWFNWFNNRVMTEWDIGGGRADLIVISRAGYVTEVEIKVSRYDWEQDRTKRKWLTEPDLAQRVVYGSRDDISRFFYAVPETIVGFVPEWIPEGVGVLMIRRRKSGGDSVVQVRPAARRKGAKKLNEQEWERIQTNCYMRYWRIKMEQIRRSGQ